MLSVLGITSSCTRLPFFDEFRKIGLHALRLCIKTMLLTKKSQGSCLTGGEIAFLLIELNQRLVFGPSNGKFSMFVY